MPARALRSGMSWCQSRPFLVVETADRARARHEKTPSEPAGSGGLLLALRSAHATTSDPCGPGFRERW
jgi:hypothetical protein